MKNKWMYLAAISAALLAAGCANPQNSRDLANPNVPGKVMAQQVCGICHGTTGNSINPTFPKLAAQQKEYLISELEEFHKHERSDPAGPQYMWGISRSLTENQIQQLATYFSEQKNVPDAPSHPSLEAQGKKIFTEGLPSQGTPACLACHGEQGAGNGMFPRIAGQHADYIVKQVLVFKKREGRPDGTAMEGITHNLTPEQIKAVAAYVSTL